MTNDIPLKLSIAEGLKLIHGGALVELRAILAGRGKSEIWSGYFLDYDKAEAAAYEAEKAGAEGIYQTLQVIHPGLYARSPDRWTKGPRHTTSDKDVIATPWVLIDVDPVRPAGISSTNAEHDQALIRRTGALRVVLMTNGGDVKTIENIGGGYILADSGNGGHLLVKFDPAAFGMKSSDLISGLSHVLSDTVVNVDRTVGKPAQLTKLYGTLTRKGYPVAGRPHRRSKITGFRMDPTNG